MTGATTSSGPVPVRRLHQYENMQALTDDVMTRMVTLANACILDHGSFHVVLTGGNTPKPIYSRLRQADTDWNCWHIYYGDERCLPLGDKDRNDRMAQEAWLDHVPIPQSQLHPIAAHLGAEDAAASYARIITAVDSLDLVLLGLGEDGHVASLFPGHTHNSNMAVVPVHDAPKPPPDRVSLSAATLSRGKHTWFLVSGEGKRDAVTRWMQGEDLPAASIKPKNGVELFTDIGGA